MRGRAARKVGVCVCVCHAAQTPSSTSAYGVYPLRRIAGPKSLELRVIASQQLPDSWSAHLGFACFSAQGGDRDRTCGW